MSWIAYHEGVLKILGVQVGFGNLDLPHIIMILVGLGFITLAILKEWEPYELLPIGAGMILANLPLTGLTSQPEPGMQPGMAGRAGHHPQVRPVHLDHIAPVHLLRHRGAHRLQPAHRQPQGLPVGRGGPGGHLHQLPGGSGRGPACGRSGASHSRRPAPSASSAGPTAPPPSTPPVCWPRTSWASPPRRPTPTWPWWPSSSRPSSSS